MFERWFNGKKKEQLLEERQNKLDLSIEKSNHIQESNSQVQKSITEVAEKNQKLNEELKNLVKENEKTRNILLERENEVRQKLESLEDRQKEIRKDEIVIEARKAETRKNEQLANERQTKLDVELKSVRERESEAESIKDQSEKAIQEYESLYKELESDKSIIDSLKLETETLHQQAKEKEESANAVFERAKIIDAEIKAKEKEFEERRDRIEESLNAKIAEYDRRLEDLESTRELVDDIKFDHSEEGRQAKIVVKEAIRRSKMGLSDLITKFDELDEKFGGGTFKGFSIPLDEIDAGLSELKIQYEQINEHFSSNEALPESVSKWLGSIEDCILKADENIKAWEFSEAYRHIVSGLSTCRNYELLLQVLSDWSSGSEEEETVDDEDFIDWYEILEVDPEATAAEIKKQYHKMMKKYHPDKNGPESDHKMAALVNEAYNILKDKESRGKFDEERQKRTKKAA
ncbi:MAG: DnaJ domain-containing protein [Flavobacteriales bacterium]|nr:DnaJ domain-containing protein [Flavobacteriales bacterium]